MKYGRLLCLLIAISGAPLFIHGCAFTAGAAAGAAGAEALDKKGYELESPVQKEDDDEEDDSG